MRSPRSIGLIVSVQVLANGFAHHAAAQTNAPATTAAHSAKDDSTVIRQLIAEYSRSISAPAGTRPDWSAFRAMFTPEARIEAIVADSAGRRTWRSQPVDDFIAAATPGMHRDGFQERPLRMRILVYGDIAHAWSGYQVTRGPPSTPRRTLGVNSFQLVRRAGHWRIAHLLWSNERAAGPLPPAWADSLAR